MKGSSIMKDFYFVYGIADAIMNEQKLHISALGLWI